MFWIFLGLLFVTVPLYLIVYELWMMRDRLDTGITMVQIPPTPIDREHARALVGYGDPGLSHEEIDSLRKKIAKVNKPRDYSQYDKTVPAVGFDPPWDACPPKRKHRKKS